MAVAEPATLRTSVVICAYNGAAYLGEQCESLLAQSRLPDQIVISDDASSDATPSILQTFASRCREAGVEAVLCVRPVNIGFINNFSDSLRLATGDVVFLCDQDDVWRSDKVEAMAARFERDADLSLLFSDARLVDAHGEALGQSLFDALEVEAADWAALDRGDAFPVLLRRAVVTGATTAFRRSLIARALPVATGWIHDEWLATVGAFFGRIALLPDPYIDYRQHGGNQIGARKRTVGMRINDIFLPRNALLQKAVARMKGLQARFGAADDAPLKWRVLLADRAVHYEQRILIGQRARVKRLPLLLAEWRTGRYRVHSNGMSSVLRDMLRAA